MEMGNMSKRQQPNNEKYTTEGHPEVFNERRGKPTPKMVYNWPLITNTRAGEIDALLDSKTYKTCITIVKHNKTYKG